MSRRLASPGRPRRAVAAFFAACLLFSVVAPSGAHGCTSETEPTSYDATTSHHTSDSHRGHAGHGESGSGDTSSDDCCCVDECCCVISVAFDTLRRATRRASVGAAPPALVADLRLRPQTAYLLPFALGPPPRS